MNVDYVAGLFDGEGSIGVYGTGGTAGTKYLSLKASIGQRRITPGWVDCVKWLQGQYGGYTSVQKTRHPGRDLLNWVVVGDKALPFLEAIKDRCLFKRDQVHLGRLYLLNSLTRAQQEEIALKLKALKLKLAA